MGRVDSAIAGVQERDKWRRRLEALEQSLEELLDHRHRLEARLHRVRDEASRLERAAKEFVEFHGRYQGGEVTIASRGQILR